MFTNLNPHVYNGLALVISTVVSSVVGAVVFAITGSLAATLAIAAIVGFGFGWFVFPAR